MTNDGILVKPSSLIPVSGMESAAVIGNLGKGNKKGWGLGHTLVAVACGKGERPEAHK